MSRKLLGRAPDGSAGGMHPPDPGFTLLELMVAIAITGIVSLSLVQMLQVGQRTSEHNRALVDMQQNARVGLEAVASDLRHVSYGKDPTQPSIHFAGSDSLVFIADILPDNAGAERISYYLSPDGDPDTPNPDDTILMRVVADTAGVALISAPQAYGVARGGLTFRWYNGSGVELEIPVPQPEQIGEGYVSLTTASGESMGGEYPTMSLSETIYPRNLPLSPARSRPSAPGCSPLTYPNCESATIAWTTPTTNTDGTELPLEDISHFSLYFGTSINDQTLYTKLARTINEWTIPGLEAGQAYYLSVTCVSRSGVESYKCTEVADQTSALVPEAVTSLTATAASGGRIDLSWSGVALFTDGSTITTPLSYVIYRAQSSGFTPDESSRLITLSGTTQYTDSTMVDCATSYYVVRARACGNEGDPSPERNAEHPALAECPTGLVGTPSASPGEISLNWTAPPLRTDGSALSPSEIQGYRVFADTLPGQETFLTEISGAVESAVIGGLVHCKSYYINLQCVDECGHPGRYCPGNEITVFTGSPCDATPPVAPLTLTVTPADDHVDLEWSANQIDCDLGGYKIYYGGSAGGPYNGAFAAQGPSPIALSPAQVTFGDVCRYSLTGLANCTSCYVQVKAIDSCDPPHESEPSPEAGDMTTCVACETDAACPAWAATGSTYNNVSFEIYTTNSGGETLTKMTPTWSGAATLLSVWYGRPLAKIWDCDGSAGEDPPGTPRPSGTELDISDVTVPSWTSEHDGQPMRIEFTGDIRDVPLSIAFKGLSGTCTAEGTGRSCSLIDLFDDGNYTANPVWQVVSSPAGNWSVSGGELVQASGNNYYVLKNSNGALGDCTYEAKIKVGGSGNRSAYLVFRYQNPNNYYLVGLETGADKVRLAKVLSGTLVTPTGGAVTRSLSDNTWYLVRLVTTGNHAKVYLDCTLVLDFDLTFAWATGGFGVTTWKTPARFDDVKLFAGNPLP